VVLGSASPDLVGLTSGSLAGRVALVELRGFRVADLGAAALDDLWVRIVVVHAGERSFPLGDRIDAVAARRLLTEGRSALDG
jgi:ABC-type enterobactin transport system permease subunit